MDDNTLKKNLSARNIPASDENAKKRAVNLALAEFDAAQQSNKITHKTFQGLSLLRRLTGSSNSNNRRSPMNKRMIYGGMATAMAVVLVAGVSYQQLNIKSGDVIDASLVSTLSHTQAPQKTSLPQPVPMAEMAMDSMAQNSASPAIAPSAPPMEMRREAKRMARAEMDIAGAGNFASGAAPGYMGGVAQSLVADDMGSYGYRDEGRDKFVDFEENGAKLVAQEPVSTFSIDVDTSSYSFVRRQINAGTLPQKDAVRVEEMINYFDYDYPQADSKDVPFKPSVTMMPSPWKDGNKLMHIAIRGFDIEADTRPRANLVFLLDTSGSMDAPDKLPLLKNSLKMLLDTMSPEDTISIVVYAGSAGTVLEPTKASDKAKIVTALDNLSAGGGTAGAEGIRQAYQLAESSFDKDAVNRVILATDGDFNVGITNPEELKDFVERKRESGIFLSVLGFGQGNYNDHMMQELAQNGNGVAAYIDTLNEARKVLVEESSSTLFPIAKDVKIQVEFNPATVDEYRLVGYETRALNREDFNNDAVDAGDIGAGHTVTAIYEITPKGGPRSVDDSRYAAKPDEVKAQTNFADEYAFLKIRYKLPKEDESKLITTPVTAANETPASEILKREANWAVAVAGFGQLLKGGKHTGKLTYDDVITAAQEAKGDDLFGYRSEFIQLVRLAKSSAALQQPQ